jgi:hypothetical protein
MTFFVTKSLATGPIRFGVTPRRTLDAIDDDAGLSTGASGDFLRRRRDAFFFADSRHGALTPSLPAAKSIRSTPFWSSLKPDGTPRGWGFLALMILGVLFILLGFSVLITKGAAGWVEVILGLAMIATPIVLTAQKRKQIAEQEERERAEREAREKREREMLAAYLAALEQLRANPGEESFEAVRREHDALELPYAIWSPAAKRTVLQIGFDALHRLGPTRAKEVSRLMTDAATAAGLRPEEEVETKTEIYRTVVWHLLADDRAGNVQAEQLKELRKGFDIWERDVPVEAKAAEEFQRLRGVTTGSLPRAHVNARLAFHEYAVHQTSGHMVVEKKKQRAAGEPFQLLITNKRVLLTTKKPVEVALSKIDDVEVNVDTNVMTLRVAGLKKPLRIEVEDPIYTASLIDMASNLNERPRSFAA